ncbi:hypothetical protein JCM14108_1099 [Lentilactobacillus farraginis DSM 18382 = JCM 14108]|uniref:Arsenical resistance operon trans-acting repressor ArsD n=1 Tax=Lentilactobacillus farraginis DSM 18382 = JCM 14108 TaxID=1423743 RepID=X0PA90_9LACO|nr:hypothetical protein JCM14108_1099 [Lentilactobacillus farraginis DSM 18382 = JCM 14108]
MAVKRLTVYARQNEQSALFKAFKKLILLKKAGRFTKALAGYKLSVVEVSSKAKLQKLDDEERVTLFSNDGSELLPIVTLDNQIIKRGSFLSPKELSQLFDGLSLQIDDKKE